MINENLIDIVKQAEESKLTLDIIFLVGVFLILWWGFRRRPVVFSLLFLTFAIIYSLNEVMATQRIESTGVDGVVSEIRVLNNSSSPFKLKPNVKLISIAPLVFSGVIQTLNMLEGSRRFNLTKRMATSVVINNYENVIYRSRLREKAPEKMIFLCQHGSDMMDVLSFFMFIPKDYKLSVMNDFTGGGGVGKKTAKAFHLMFAKHLYGAHMIDRKDKTVLKRQMGEFANMLIDAEKEVFCIWPSGKIWDPVLKNGIENFKPGAFYISAYTGVPVCVIHQRICPNKKTLIIEQSELVYPPVLEKEGLSYIDFYEREDYQPVIDEYRRRVENLYRGIDDRLESEITKEQYTNDFDKSLHQFGNITNVGGDIGDIRSFDGGR